MLGSCWDEACCGSRELQVCAQGGDRSLLLPWVVAAAVPARPQLLEMLAGLVAGPWSVLPHWPKEIYQIQPVPTSPCYLRQAGGSASLFVEGQLSPWLPAHTQPCTTQHPPSSSHSRLGQRKFSQEEEEEGAVCSEDLNCFSHLIW